jgi:uncharacterized RDD family membrane protein YckC
MSTPDPNAPNPYAPPTARVQDLADSSGPGELADRGSRLGAYILDAIILAIVYLPAIVGAIPNLAAVVGARPSPVVTDRLAIYKAFYIGNPYLLYALALFLIWTVITILFVVRNGQSIGKRIVGIKVVRTNGMKASFWRIFLLRNVVNALPGFIPIVSYVYGLVDILMIFGESRQCLHDRIATTIVVKA